MKCMCTTESMRANANASVLFCLVLLLFLFLSSLCVIIWLAWWFCSFFLYAHSSSVVFPSISLVRTYAKLAHLDHTSIVLLCTLFGTIVSMCIIFVVLWLSIIVDLQMLLFNCHKIIWWITLYSALLFRVLCFAFANCVLTIHSNVIQFGDDAHHLISNVEL